MGTKFLFTGLLIWKKPFKDRKYNRVMIINEFLASLALISVIILHGFGDAEKARAGIYDGWGINCMIFVFAYLAYTLGYALFA